MAGDSRFQGATMEQVELKVSIDWEADQEMEIRELTAEEIDLIGGGKKQIPSGP